jgi:hypothetical protein
VEEVVEEAGIRLSISTGPARDRLALSISRQRVHSFLPRRSALVFSRLRDQSTNPQDLLLLLFFFRNLRDQK